MKKRTIRPVSILLTFCLLLSLLPVSAAAIGMDLPSEEDTAAITEELTPPVGPSGPESAVTAEGPDDPTTDAFADNPADGEETASAQEAGELPAADTAPAEPGGADPADDVPTWKAEESGQSGLFTAENKVPAGALRAPAANGADRSSVFHATITANNDTYESGTTAIVSVKYTLEPGTISPGDYVVVTIPEDIASSVSFSLNAQHFSGYEYLGGGQYRLTFAEGAETGLSGSFSAFVTTNADTITTDTITVGDASKEITVVPGGSPGGTGVYTDTIMKDAAENPGVGYGGYDYSDGYGGNAAQIGVVDLTNGGTFKYRLYVNSKEGNLSNATVIDQLPDGMTWNAEKGFEVLDAQSGDPIDPALYTIGVSGQTITFTYPGAFSNRIQINYWVDIPAGSDQAKFTNTATVTYTQDGGTYQEHRNYVLQGTANSASNGEKSVDKTVISTDPDDQFVTYTIKFWNSNGFDAGEINLVDQLDPHVRYVSAAENEYFSIVQDSADPQKILITNTKEITGSMTVYVRFIVDMTDVPEGYTVENTVGGNTTKTTKDISLQLRAAKTVDGREPGEQRFDFELCDADGAVLQTVQNDDAGEIRFAPLNFSAEEIGTHVYTLREKENPDSLYVQDTAVYTAAVTVTRTESGALKADVVYTTGGNSVAEGDVVFHNVSLTTSVSGTKTWVGDDETVRPASITVNLLADGEKVDSKTITAADNWRYQFTDLPKYCDGAEIQYKVTEEKVGGYQTEVNGFDLVNTYSPVPTSVTLGGTKTFTGYPEDAEAPVFAFTLSEDGKTIDTKTTTGAGSYQFDSITYGEAGTHVYTVAETTGDAAGVTYDTKTYTVTVEVTDDGSGQLQASISGDSTTGMDLNFTNSYKAAPTSVQFAGTKTLEGKALQDGEFSFTLTGSDGTDETVTNDGAGKITFSEISYDKAGTYTYEVKEDATDEAGVSIDSTIYHITVEVTDDGSGQLQAAISGDSTTGTDLNFTNSYESGNLVLRKTVTGNLGDKNQEFTFTITFDATGAYAYSGSKSGVLASGDSVTLKHGEYIEITGLPAGTEYAVAESKNAGYQVTVSGNVGTITAGETAVAAFTNHRSSAPQTGDHSDLTLWMIVLLVSGTGLPATRLIGNYHKKRHR